MTRSVEPKVIETQELRLTDDSGNPRAVLKILDDGQPSLSMLNQDGLSVATFDLAEDDAPQLMLRDSKGHPRIILQITEGEHPIIRVCDHSRQTRVIIGRDEQQYWSIRLFRAGQLIWRTPTYRRRSNGRMPVATGDNGGRKPWFRRLLARSAQAGDDL